MRIRPRFLLAAVALVAGLTTGVYGRADVNDAPLQYQIGTLLFDETRAWISERGDLSADMEKTRRNRALLAAHPGLTELLEG